jgi:nucleotide-binding universal stress UspA family protein
VTKGPKTAGSHWWIGGTVATATFPPPPDPPRRVLVASPASPLPPEVLAKAVELASPEHARITVLGIARIFGTSLGLPHPGLQPTAGEWEEERAIVNEAADELRRRGFEVRVAFSRSRNAPKMIARWARAKNFHAIVVPDPERPRWRRAIEGDLTREIARRCNARVHAVPLPPVSHGRPRAS